MQTPSSKTSFERWLNDNPDHADPRYVLYVKRRGTCWGHFFREHHAAEFNKKYKTFWLRNPQLWEAEVEL